MATNLKLLAIFIVYVSVELLFAKAYFSIYQKQPANYAFDKSVLDQKIEEAKLSHIEIVNNNSKVKYLECFEMILVGDGDLWDARERNIPFDGQLYYHDSLVYIVDYYGGMPSFYYDISVFTSVGDEVADFRLSDNLGSTLRKRVNTLIASLNDEASNSLETLSKIKSNEPFPVWNYWDFVYFSNRKISGEIIPNNSSVRRLATLQDFTHVILLGFLVNASFGVIKWIKNKNSFR